MMCCNAWRHDADVHVALFEFGVSVFPTIVIVCIWNIVVKVFSICIHVWDIIVKIVLFPQVFTTNVLLC